ncbi:hypothetical protein DIPPA_16129 [Diplonema papillatum]|nr:hypothetical protein DIPPA_16129 [Diplonema papillatum]
MDQLQELFQSFCNFGAGQRGAYQMTNAMFAKFCKDSRVLDRKFTATDADLLFSKIKPKGGRTISFDCFRYQGVPEIALKKGIKTDELVERMLSNHGPTSSGTVGDNVRFHDDKSQYTGVHKNGGPTNVDLGQHGKSEMDNSRFAKFCKDAKLYDRTFTAIDADLLFSKVKPKGQRVIGFEVWVSVALPEIARRKNMQTADLVKKLEGLSPSTNATEADNVRFHDDKSQYTGVYKAGGPTNVDLGTSDLRYITNRAPADVRGVQQAS